MKATPVLLLMLPICLACADSGTEASSAPPLESAGTSQGYKVETVVSNVEVPWSIVWTSKDRMLFTERPGRVRVYEGGKLREAPLLRVTDLTARSESGLMGMCLHPDYATNKFVYLAYSYGRRSTEFVRVVRYRDTGDQLVEPKTIIEELPAAVNHAGCRIKFGPDKKLYVTVGDATDRNIAQDMSSLGGKILRLNDDGSAPSDNPFVGKAGHRPEIWIYGSRNAQGIDWQPGTGLLFGTEHGPSGFDGPGGGDEVNIYEKGQNYGWPAVSHRENRSGMVGPLLEYTPAVAPASGMFYTGDLLKEYKGNFFFGCLRGSAIIRVVLDGRKVVSQERIMTSYGRIREVAQGPDGAIYFSTSNRDGRGGRQEGDDRIIRIR